MIILIDSINIEYKYIPTVRGIPDTCDIEYIGKLPTGIEFIVFRPKEDWKYSDFTLVIGIASRFEQVAIDDISRYRDGGTTIIKTKLGTFTFPTPFHPDRMATLDDKPLTMFDRKKVVRC